MPKFATSNLGSQAARFGIAIMAAIGLSGTAHAALGRDAATCDANRSAILVHIEGFKSHTGTVRVQLYDDNQKTFLEKGKYLSRIDVPVSGSGAMDICVKVPRPGGYALSIRHDANGNDHTDKSDGGGFSGNPDMSFWDIVSKNKPNVRDATIRVGGSTVRTTVTLNYVQGLSFQPVKGFR